MDPNFANGVSGNFTFSISDHLPQFLVMPDELKHTHLKSTTYTEDPEILTEMN